MGRGARAESAAIGWGGGGRKAKLAPMQRHVIACSILTVHRVLEVGIRERIRVCPRAKLALLQDAPVLLHLHCGNWGMFGQGSAPCR
jgi:hypothetical protein